MVANGSFWTGKKALEINPKPTQKIKPKLNQIKPHGVKKSGRFISIIYKIANYISGYLFQKSA